MGGTAVAAGAEEGAGAEGTAEGAEGAVVAEGAAVVNPRSVFAFASN